MILDIKCLTSQVPVPVKATKFSACYDLSFYPNIEGDQIVRGFSPNSEETFLTIFQREVTIQPGYRALVPTGLKLTIPSGHHVKVFSRSSMALKRGLVCVNSVGIIDEDYDEPLFVLLMNVSEVPVTLKIGERIGQFELAKTTDIIFCVDGMMVNASSDTKRNGGLGSTGK